MREEVQLKPDLIGYLPLFYHEIKEMIVLQSVLSEELGALYHNQEDVTNQLFVKTATWGLNLWEQFLNLPTDKSKTYEHRREIIIAKLRGAGTTTKSMIKNVASAFAGGDVDVLEYPDKSHFEVKFVGVKGIPPNMDGLIQALDDIKPAHLTYEFKYTFTVWNALTGMTWDDVNQMSWDQLRETDFSNEGGE